MQKKFPQPVETFANGVKRMYPNCFINAEFQDGINIPLNS